MDSHYPDSRPPRQRNISNAQTRNSITRISTTHGMTLLNNAVLA